MGRLDVPCFRGKLAWTNELGLLTQTELPQGWPTWHMGNQEYGSWRFLRTCFIMDIAINFMHKNEWEWKNSKYREERKWPLLLVCKEYIWVLRVELKSFSNITPTHWTWRKLNSFTEFFLASSFGDIRQQTKKKNENRNKNPRHFSFLQTLARSPWGYKTKKCFPGISLVILEIERERQGKSIYIDARRIKTKYGRCHIWSLIFVYRQSQYGNLFYRKISPSLAYDIPEYVKIAY